MVRLWCSAMHLTRKYMMERVAISFFFPLCEPAIDQIKFIIALSKDTADGKSSLGPNIVDPLEIKHHPMAW